MSTELEGIVVEEEGAVSEMIEACWVNLFSISGKAVYTDEKDMIGHNILSGG